MSGRHPTPVAATFGVRVAGLPATVPQRLVDERLRHALLATARTATELTARAAALSDRCYAVIGALPEPAAKPKLVALRRCVHQLRDTSRLLADPLVAAALGEELAADVAEFAHRVARHRAERAQLPALLTEAERAVTAALREIAADPRFDQGLTHASPTLREVLQRRPGRQELIRLAVYATRAAVKTSPFSTFTASGLGSFVPDGPALRWTATAPARSVVELDLAALVPLAAERTPATEARVGVNPSARPVPGAVRFLGPAPTEELLSLPLTAPLRHCLRAAATRPTLAELTAALPAPPERATAYLRALLDAGLLLAPPSLDEHGPDPLGELVRRAPELTPVRAALRAYAHAEGSERAALGATLSERLAPLGVTGRLRDVVTEQSVIPGVVVEAGLSSWRAALDDLALACRLLAVFDHTLPFKLAIAAFVREWFGARTPVPFDRFYAELVRNGGEAMRLHPAAVAFAATGPTGTLAASPIPEVRRLAGLIGEVRRALPDRQRIAQVLDALPDWVRPVGSVAVYTQYDAGRLVVNAVNSGYGRGRSQLRRLLSAAGGDPLPVAAVHPGGTRYAEFAQTLATSLNQRELALPERLDYPPPARLTVGVGADGLPVLLDGAAPVRPVHGGLSYERQLPPVMALLVEAFGESPILLRPDQPLRHDAAAGTGTARVLHAPRLDIGRVVLRRATWVAQPGTLPRRAPGQRDADFLLLLAAWLTEHGIPPRFFVSVLRPGDGTAGSLARDRARKPLLVDIGSPPLVLAFEKLAADPAAAAVLSEVVPGPETALTDQEGLPRVTEFLIELNCQGDGR
ncbi:lantibiotic dehydratase family protein [Kitasatospora sp. DSM 101779]|uniref:lantibiotic dehydratase family protein n=1 Tax=Kitasatospora sp. DSM 101779 TaxID=2853165 RepID=UPI0021DB2A2A|nr:lantibiotic dehydratase family protein [Kitasatospora sp. DSM 101779]MCU7826904.1 lantibiotic dehydratase family protein [Kitasatospora sp. DSM 101779]